MVQPVDGSVMGTQLHFYSGASKVEVWAAIIKGELVGPFQVDDGLKIKRKHFLQAVIQKKILIFHDDHDFYAGHKTLGLT